MKVDEVLKLYAIRDKLAMNEQKLEDKIFEVSPPKDDVYITHLSKAYRVAKDKRSEASIRAAIAYMQLEADEKILVTSTWKKSKEGLRKARTTGIRGKTV